MKIGTSPLHNAWNSSAPTDGVRPTRPARRWPGPGGGRDGV